MKNNILTVMKKELARFFGDKRMLLSVLILPGVMIYAMYSLMGNAISGMVSVDDEYTPSIYSVNTPQSMQTLFESADIKINEISQDEIDLYKNNISAEETDLLIEFPADFDKKVDEFNNLSGNPAPNIEIYYNSSANESAKAFDNISNLIGKYEEAITNKFDINNSQVKYDLADDKDITGMIFSTMMPMLIMVFLFSGCLAVAPESIAGEKERGTIATLLVTPIKRSELAIGKITALAIISLLSGASSTIGIVFALPKLMGEEADATIYGISDYLWLAAVILSTVLVLITLISIISTMAKTIKEAQTYVMPLMIVVMLIGISSMFGNSVNEATYLYFIPMYNSVQSMSAVFSFELVPLNMAVTLISNIIYCAIGIFAITKMFENEKIMFKK